ncbi:MAG: hypothetical protein ABEL76_04485 [Bradymonadaceae bacterium]
MIEVDPSTPEVRRDQIRLIGRMRVEDWLAEPTPIAGYLALPTTVAIAVAVIGAWSPDALELATLHRSAILAAFASTGIAATCDLPPHLPAAVRELRLELDPTTYVFGELRALGLLAAVQVGCLLAAYAFQSTLIPVGWLYLVLLASALAGGGFGILAAVGTRRRRTGVLLVASATVGQWLIAGVSGADPVGQVAAFVYFLTPTGWADSALVHFSGLPPRSLIGAIRSTVPLFFAGLFTLSAGIVLRRRIVSLPEDAVEDPQQ